MDYNSAIKACMEGTVIRHPDMDEGWVIRQISWRTLGGGGHGFFCINPYTGSDYLFTPTERDIERQDWYEVGLTKPQRIALRHKTGVEG